jgi:hypothetical protein
MIDTSIRTPWAARARRLVGKALTLAVLSSVFALAVALLQPWASFGSGPASPAGADDPVANGLRIVHTPAVAAATQETTATADSADEDQAPTLLADWEDTAHHKAKHKAKAPHHKPKHKPKHKRRPIIPSSQFI